MPFSTPGYENIQLVQLGAEGTTGRQGGFLLMAKGNDLEREGISKVKLVDKGYMFPSVVPTLPGTALDTTGSHHGYNRIPFSRLQFDPWLAMARKLVHPIFPPAV